MLFFHIILQIQKLAINAYQKNSLKTKKCIIRLRLSWTIIGGIIVYIVYKSEYANIGCWIFLIGCFVLYLIDIAINLAGILTSLRKFFTTATSLSFILGISVSMLVGRQIYDGIIWLFIGFGLSWVFFSLIANSAVSSTVNAIAAGILAIITLSINSFIQSQPSNSNLNFPIYVLEALKIMELTPIQVLQISINLITIPLLIINSLALLACEVKKYWIHKYNNDKENLDFKVHLLYQTRSEK